MAFAVRDAMAGGKGTRTKELLEGPGLPHIFLTYIGIGFAMARLPRILWRDIMPDLEGVPFFPTMSWLAVDGYGFDRAYFHTRQVVDEQRPFKPYPWAGRADYFPRAADQGLGRALWFIHGALPDRVAAAVDAFPESRRADLWSGVGLAATFAGGASAEGLADVAAAAGSYADEVALGATFAGTARLAAGHLPEHSKLGVEVLTGRTVEEAVMIAATAAGEPGETERPSDPPAYELWRERIRQQFRATGAAEAA
jgi:hypothetical protein